MFVLISLGFVLVVILALLIFLFFKVRKRRQIFASKEKVAPLSLEDLIKILANKKTSSQALSEALELVLKYYPTIDDFDVYTIILVKMTRHPHTNKKIILHFDKELSRLNPSYKKEISDTITYSL